MTNTIVHGGQQLDKYCYSCLIYQLLSWLLTGSVTKFWWLSANSGSQHMIGISMNYMSTKLACLKIWRVDQLLLKPPFLLNHTILRGVLPSYFHIKLPRCPPKSPKHYQNVTPIRLWWCHWLQCNRFLQVVISRLTEKNKYWKGMIKINCMYIRFIPAWFRFRGHTKSFLRGFFF